MEFITLDLVPGKIQPVCNASQYDAGRQIGINVTENGTPFNLLASDLIIYSEKKPDGNIVTMDVAHDAGTSFVFVTTEQMTAVTGSCICQFTLKRDGVKIGSLDFFLIVEADPTDHGVTSHSEINNLERQVSELVDEQIAEDLSHYYTKEETYSSEEIDNALDLKANASDVYDKTEIDTALALKANTSDVNTALALKADKATTYNKTEVDNLVAPKADKSYVDSELATKADQATTYSKTEVDALINALPTPMVFKGTLGTGGTITTLPVASAENEGYTYKVITAGTYQGIVCKVGDVVTSNGSDWVLIPSGDTDSDTWRAIKINGTEKLSNAISSGAVDFEQGDNITITFDADGNKIIVATTGIYTKAEVDALIAGKCDYPTETASGTIASFNTDLASALKECEVSFTAYQASGTPTPSVPIPISGYSSATVVRMGKNLFNYNAVTPYNANVTVTKSNGDLTVQNDNSYPLNALTGSEIYLKSGTYTISISEPTTAAINIYKGNTWIAAGISVGNTSGTFTITNSDTYVLNSNVMANSSITIKKLQIEAGTQPSIYENYSGMSVVIPFGNTYYGGVLDILNGIGLVTDTPNTDPSISISFTPGVINTLKGLNNMFADIESNLDITYTESVKFYFDKQDNA